MAKFEATTIHNDKYYVHSWIVAIMVVLLFLYAVKCQWPIELGEGLAGGPCSEWGLARGAGVLRKSGADLTSAHPDLLEQGEVNFQPTVSCQGMLDGYAALNATNPWQESPSVLGFLGGPQAPLFSAPPSSPGMTGHGYMKAVHDAQKALAAGASVAGAQAVVAAENFVSSSSKGGISDELLMSSLGGGSL